MWMEIKLISIHTSFSVMSNVSYCCFGFLLSGLPWNFNPPYRNVNLHILYNLQHMYHIRHPTLFYFFWRDKLENVWYRFWITTYFPWDTFCCHLSFFLLWGLSCFCETYFTWWTIYRMQKFFKLTNRRLYVFHLQFFLFMLGLG